VSICAGHIYRHGVFQGHLLLIVKDVEGVDGDAHGESEDGQFVGGQITGPNVMKRDGLSYLHVPVRCRF
jgi:hypothetical protein